MVVTQQKIEDDPRYLSGKLNGINKNKISVKDKDGNIWFGSDGYGISIFNTIDKSFRSLKKNPNSPSTISDNIIKKLYKDNNSLLIALIKILRKACIILY